jgi:hypothetical protein
MLLDEFAYNGFGSNGGGGIALQGVQGTQGTQGTQGVQGVDGKFIGQGVQGLIGEIGLQGVQAVQGAQGIPSSQGLQGQIGLQGSQGSQGSQSIQGFQGIQALQGLQFIQGVQGVIGIQGTPLTATPSVWGYFFRTADFIFPTPNTFNQQVVLQGVSGSNFDARYTPSIPPAPASASFAQVGSQTNKVSFRWRVYAIFENIGGTDEEVQYFNAWYISFFNNIRTTIKAGTQKQIFYDYISANTNIDFVYVLTYGFLVTSTNLVLTDLRIVDYRVADSPIAGIQGLQGVQGVQGQIGSAQQLAFDAQKGVGTAIQALNFDGVQYTFSAQQGNFNNGLYFGVQTIQGITPLEPYYRVNGYFSIRNYGASAMDANVIWISRDNSSGGTGLTIGGSRIPADGRVYVIPFTFLWRNESDTNQDVHFNIQAEIVGTSTNYTDFEYVGAVGTPSFNVVGNQVSGTQGLQGTIQGTQGLQGTTGFGSQGIQGVQGIESAQGVDGIQGLQGLIASQGIQGTQAIQGVQGIQGFESFANDASAFCSVTNSVSQSISATTNTKIQFDAESATASYFSVDLGNERININEGGFFKVSILLNIEGNATNSSDVYVYAYSVDAGFTGIPSTTTLKKVGVGQYETLVFEAIFYSPRRNYYEFYIYSTQAITLYAQSAVSPYPSGFSSRVSMSLVSRDYENTENAILTWDSGFFNLTNGIDNPIPFSTYTESASATGIASFGLSGANASFNITETGVYMIDTFASFYDLGSGITMSTTLYTSTSPVGVGWSFLTITGLQRYQGTNTNQIQQGKYLLRVTSQIYVQMRVNPSGNSPFPYNVSSAYTNMVITRIGDI